MFNNHFFTRTDLLQKKWEGDIFSAPQVGPRPIHLQGPRTNVNLQNQTMKHESPSAGGFCH